MKNVFDDLRANTPKRTLISKKSFTAEELDMVIRAIAWPSQFYCPKLSCLFLMKTGEIFEVAMVTDLEVSAGDVIDLSKAKMVTMKTEGTRDSHYIDY